MIRKYTVILSSLLLNIQLFGKADPVSFVDTSLENAEKYVLKVDGKPFYMTNVQLRLDKLRGYEGWGDEALEAVVRQAASDGFNTVSLPLFWREVEPVKDNFDWAILDQYLDWCHKYDLKMELLWFSFSSGGRIQWLTRNKKRPAKNGHCEFLTMSAINKGKVNLQSGAPKTLGLLTGTTQDYGIGISMCYQKS